MKLTNPERLILVMLAGIYKKLEIDDDIDVDLLTSAIYSDNTWALDWEMTGLFGDRSEPNPPEVTEVVNALDMWSFLEEAYERFDAKEKEEVRVGASPFQTHVSFPGYDGNNETRHISIASFLVEKMGRFTRFKGRDLNSHAPSCDKYERMYAVFDPIRAILTDGGLSPKQMIEVLKDTRYDA